MEALCKACAQPFTKSRWGRPILNTSDSISTGLNPVVRGEGGPRLYENCPLAALLGSQHNARFLKQSRMRNSDDDVLLEYGLDQPHPVTFMLRIPQGRCLSVVMPLSL